MSDSEDEPIVGFSSDTGRASLLPRSKQQRQGTQKFERELQPLVQQNEGEEPTFEIENREEFDREAGE